MGPLHLLVGQLLDGFLHGWAQFGSKNHQI
jgi:hypothetical protein